MRSLDNKMDELAGLVRTQRVYRESSVLCFTEMWLREDTPDGNVTVDGFQTVRADRSHRESGKKKGGGLANCLFIYVSLYFILFFSILFYFILFYSS